MVGEVGRVEGSLGSQECVVVGGDDLLGLTGMSWPCSARSENKGDI